MAAQMLSRRGQRLSRLLAKPSFAGTGLLERMRSTTFALLGITAAMGLGLVAIVSQQGWPLLPASPLPGAPAERGEVHDATAVAPDLPSSVAQLSIGKPARGSAADRVVAPPQPRASHLSGSRQLAVAPPSPPSDPGADSPTGDGAAPPPEPSEQPSSETPAAAPAPSPAPEPASIPAAPAAVSPPSAPEPPVVSTPTNRGRGNAYGKYKSGGWKGGKKPDYSAPEAPTSSPSPPVAEPDEYAEDEVEPSEDDVDGDSSYGYHGRGRGHGYGHSRH
jgi:hypothetical protein